ncbi:MAG: hypothetical protein D8M58_07515 [Calditrichaeota bacterium]|nr:MAG: hypothetical protein DWQ03_18975 [Calditrichota bacterium]MBL1205229.1 hypothetical protein [Calditrichota bacterium]NOG45058.1 hypothetical protein [Calditrichota bacterium]
MQINKVYHKAILLFSVATLFFIGCENELPNEVENQGAEERSILSIEKRGSYSIIPIAKARIDIQRDYVPDLADNFVTIKGVISTPNLWDPNSGAVHHFIQGYSAGIQLFAFPHPEYYPNLTEAPVLNMGDEVVLKGRVVHWKGGTIIRLEYDGDLQIIGKRTIKKPRKIRAAQLADQVGERIEGQLVMLEKVRLVEGDQFPNEGYYGLIRVVDSRGNIAKVFIDEQTDIDGSSSPNGWFNLTGVVNQFTEDNPADNGYQIVPRGLFDID